MAIDALFRRCHLQDRINIEDLVLLHLAVDGNGPGAGFEILGKTGGLIFLGGEFVEIVVGAYILIGILLFGGAERAFLDAVNLGVGFGDESGISETSGGTMKTDARDRRRAGERRASQKAATVQVSGFGSNFRKWNLVGFPDQHCSPLMYFGPN